MVRDSNSYRGKRFLYSPNFHTYSGAQPSLLPNEFFSGSKAARALVIHLHLLQMLGITGVMPILPYRISRRQQGHFTFTSAISFHHKSYMDWRRASEVKGLRIKAHDPRLGFLTSVVCKDYKNMLLNFRIKSKYWLKAPSIM